MSDHKQTATVDLVTKEIQTLRQMLTEARQALAEASFAISHQEGILIDIQAHLAALRAEHGVVTQQDSDTGGNRGN